MGGEYDYSLHPVSCTIANVIYSFAHVGCVIDIGPMRRQWSRPPQ